MRTAPLSVDRIMGMTLHEVKGHAALRAGAGTPEGHSDSEDSDPKAAAAVTPDASAGTSVEGGHAAKAAAANGQAGR